MEEINRFLDDEEEIENLFPDYNVFDLDQIPDHGSWALPMLKKINDDDKTYVWQIMFDESISSWVTSTGRLDGIKSEHPREVEPKAGRSLQEQAKQDITKKHRDKLDQGYFPSIEVEMEDVRELMLASQYNPDKIAKYPMAVQFKFDGERAWIRIEEGFPEGVAIRSRTKKAIGNLNHLRLDLLNFFQYLPVGAMLDGELYIHGEHRNEIRSAIGAVAGKSKKVNPMNKLVKYVIFDLIDRKKILEDRIDILAAAYDSYKADFGEDSSFVILPTFMAFDEDNLDCFLDMATDMEYEGLILRYFGGECVGDLFDVEDVDPISGEIIETSWCKLKVKKGKKPHDRTYYKYGRSVGMFKVKKFLDEEGEIIDVVSAKGREKGAAMFVLRNPAGAEFSIRPRGTIEWRREVFRNKEDYIGRHYEYMYQNKSKYDIPQILKPVGFRD